MNGSIQYIIECGCLFSQYFERRSEKKVVGEMWKMLEEKQIEVAVTALAFRVFHMVCIQHVNRYTNM